MEVSSAKFAANIWLADECGWLEHRSAIDQMPEKEGRIIDRRLAEWRKGIKAHLRGIAEICAPTPDPDSEDRDRQMAAHGEARRRMCDAALKVLEHRRVDRCEA